MNIKKLFFFRSVARFFKKSMKFEVKKIKQKTSRSLDKYKLLLPNNQTEDPMFPFDCLGYHY